MAACKVLASLAVVAVAAAAVGWVLSAPTYLDAKQTAEFGKGEAARGERIFYAGGCTSCHAKPGAQGDAVLELAGGLELKTPFGTFVAPNISSDPDHGIGGWSEDQFANAVMRGVAPDGSHYYPAFPYTSYARMNVADVSDLYAFMKTLPAVQTDAPGHQLGFPFNIRRGIGLWKRLFLSPDPVIALDASAPDDLNLGRYLVEGPGHCGECHTPRNFAGGTEKPKWLSGAVAAEGDGNVPNITPGEGGLGWSADEIAYYLESGFTPEFDSVGGAMVAVQRNMARLRPEDREAIAAYLKIVPPLPNGYPNRQ
ncbi:MAG: cytochrome c [Rhizobiaceae bacterium]|nr:cytochrome c [Rhizobiaceae bacterium]